MDGYLILMVGGSPHYRIIYNASQKEMLATLSQLKTMTHIHIDVLHIVNGDTINAYKAETNTEFE